MGVVYLGRDPVIGRLVALKTIRAVSEDDVEQREFQERFLREAQAAGILSHPNIVTVHDVGEDSSTETSFIAMEYVEGKNLKQLLSEKTPYSAERTAEIVGQVLRITSPTRAASSTSVTWASAEILPSARAGTAKEAAAAAKIINPSFMVVPFVKSSGGQSNSAPLDLP